VKTTLKSIDFSRLQTKISWLLFLCLRCSINEAPKNLHVYNAACVRHSP